MFKLVIFGSFLFLNLFSNILNAQGLNNNYKIDQSDLANILKLNNIDVFKYPVSNNVKAEVFIEQYENGIISDSLILNLSEIQLSDNKERINIKKNVIPKSSTRLLRIYFKKGDENLELLIQDQDVEQKIEFDFKDIKLYGSRMFDTKPTIDKYKIRVLAYYGVKSDSVIMHCAGNENNEQLCKRMDNLIILYLRYN